MGVSPQAFRVRIGLFDAARRKCCNQTEKYCGKKSNGGHDELQLKFLPSILLCLLLLLISGIEQNPGPGPNFKCNVCGCSYQTAKNYFLHRKVHLSVKPSQRTYKVACVFDNCRGIFSTFKSFEMHMSRCHKDPDKQVREGVTHGYNCPLQSCSVSKEQDGDLKSHLERHLDQGDSFVCPLNDCGATHRRKAYFRTHLSRYHSSEEISRLTTLTEQADETPSTSQHADSGLPSASDNIDDNTMDWCYDEGDTAEIPDCSPREEDVENEPFELYPPKVVRDEILKFYFKLEGVHLLPSTTVQAISEEIALMTEMSQHLLKRSLLKNMVGAGVDKTLAESIISQSFMSDVVYNVHHKHHSMFQVSSTHLRKKHGKLRFPYVEPIEIPLGFDNAGKARYCHYVPVRDTLQVLVSDEKIKSEILASFSLPEKSGDILEDFTDGRAFQDHKLQHENGKCLQLIFFQDAFEFNPFGPASGLYKSLGVYFTLGNLSAEYRSKVDMIQLACMIQERDLKPSEEEYLKGVNKFEVVLKRLLDDLQELKLNGIKINDETIPVCLLFFTGDNLGSHQIGSFVQSFTAMFTCRFCPISKDEFKANPHECKDLRTPDQYDEYVAIAKRKWDFELKKAIKEQQKRKQKEASRISLDKSLHKKGKRALQDGIISKFALKKLRAINFRGVKPIPSALNKVPGFHVCSPSLCPCLAHDIFEGTINAVLPKVLKHLIEEQEWFTLETLNRRIRTFTCKGADSADAPNVIKSYDSIKGHACENWTLLRLLPFIIGDLIQDQDNPVWQLFLKLKQICEYVCAPKITLSQVAYLKSLIGLYLCDVKKLLPSCLTPKHHYLCHYPDLIFLFGPLIRLWTMRFESKHVFFKAVARACKNFINITSTLVQKYQYRFAYDHSQGVIPPDVQYDSTSTLPLIFDNLSQDVKSSLQSCQAIRASIGDLQVLKSVTIKGISYKKDLWLVMGKENSNDLSVGCIDLLICTPSDQIYFVLKQHVAENTFCGYYSIEDQKNSGVCVKQLQDLPDYYALSSYNYMGKSCLSLKHSVTCM